MKLDVVTLTQGNWILLENCLSSLETALSSTQNIDLRVFIGINELNLAVPLAKFSHLKLEIFWIDLKTKEKPGAARNRVLIETTAPWIYFLDDDACVHRDLLHNFLKLQQTYPQYSVLGGPNLTNPSSPDFEKLSGYWLSSKFVTSVSASRYKPLGEPRATNELELILCNLFVKREFLVAKQFSVYLDCAEENELLQFWSEQGTLQLYSPTLRVFHKRRSTAKDLLNQISKYGRGRGQLIHSRGASAFRWQHLVPTFFFAYTLCLIYYLFKVAVVKSEKLTFIFALPMMAYFLILLYISLKALSVVRKMSAFSTSFVLIPQIHFAYSNGVLVGIFQSMQRTLHSKLLRFRKSI
jgi:succinoglycan biosynthesis protein ExoA